MNEALSMEAAILTFNSILTQEAASVTVSHIYFMIKTKLNYLGVPKYAPRGSVVTIDRWVMAGEESEATGPIAVCYHCYSSHHRTLQYKLLSSYTSAALFV